MEKIPLHEFKCWKLSHESLGHTLLPADDPVRAARGILCNDCDSGVTTFAADFDSDSSLVAWAAESRNRVVQRPAPQPAWLDDFSMTSSWIRDDDG